MFSGVWNVPYVSACYLINGTLIRQPETKPSYIYNQLDADMAFCTSMREKVSNFICLFCLDSVEACKCKSLKSSQGNKGYH